MPGLQFDVALNTADFMKNVKEMQKEANMTTQELRKWAQVSLEDLKQNIKIQTSEVKRLRTQMDSADKTLKSMYGSKNKEKIKEQSELVKQLTQEFIAENEALNNMRDRERNLNQVITQTVEEEKKLAEATRETEEAQKREAETAKKHNKTLISLLGGQEKYNALMNALPPSVRNAVTAIEQMTTAAKAFIATPLGVILAGIVFVLGTLYTALSSSAEGEMTLVKYSGYLEGALKALKEVVIDLGKFLVECFKSPKKAAEDFLVFLGTQYINRVTAFKDVFKQLAYMMQHFMDKDFSWKQFGDDFTNTLTKLSTGVDGLGAKLKNITTKTSELNLAEEKLNRDRSKWQIQEAEKNKELAQLRKQMYAASDNATKKRLQDEAARITKEKYDMQRKFATEALRIRKERNALTTSSQADIDEENRLQAELINVDSQEMSEMTFFDRRGASSDRAEEQQQRKAAKQLAQLKAQRAKAEAAMARQLRQQVTQAEIDAMAEGTDKKLAQINLNYQKELDAVDKMQDEYLNQKRQMSKTEYEAKNPTGVFDPETIQLTKEELQKFQELKEKALQVYIKTLDDFEYEEQQSRISYLAEYGNFEEKKLAIAQKYAKLIAEAGSDEYKAMSLEKEMKKELSGIDMDRFKDSINWEGIFGNLENVARSKLKDLRAQIVEFMKSDEFKNATSVDSKKELMDALNNIDAQIQAREGAIASYILTKKDQKRAEENYQKAQIEYTAAFSSEQEVRNRYKLGKATDKELEDAREKTRQTKATKDQAEKDKQNISAKVLPKMLDAVNQINDNIQALPGLMSSLGALGVEEDSPLGSTLSGVADVANNAMGAYTDFMSGNYIGALTKGINAIDGVVALFDKGNLEEMNEEIERLSAANVGLAAAIDDLTDSLNEGSVSDASKTYEKALSLLQKQEENSSRIMQDEAAKWSHGSHSIQSQLNDSASFSSLLAKAGNILGVNLQTSRDFLALSAKEMKELRMQDADLYNNILQAFRDVENSKTGSGIDELIAQYIDDFAEAEDNLNAALREKLTSTNLDSIKDEFKNVLTDMTSSAQDFTDNFENMMRTAIINSMMSQYFDAQLEEWQKDFAKAMEDGDMSQTELDRLRLQYDSLMEQAVEQRDRLLDVVGLDTSSSSSTGKSVSSMSQETADELNGRFTAFQLSNEAINQNTAQAVASLQAMLTIKTEDSRILGEIQNLMVTGNGYLEDIAKYTKELEGQKEAIIKLVENSNKL